MTFEILSERHNKHLFIISLFILLMFIVSAVISIRTDCIFANVLLVLIVIFWLSPFSLGSNKIIGYFELNDNYISFTTQQHENVKLNLSEVTFCKLEYMGFKGDMHLIARGWVWNSGINVFEIKTKGNQYKILFLSKDIDDENKLIKYIDVLKKNNISYHFGMKDQTYNYIKDVDPQ